jgi:type 1 glutamine amidotransferase
VTNKLDFTQMFHDKLKMTITTILLLAICGFMYLPPLHAQAANKINVLLLSGSNNHDWQKTTPMLQSILDDNGLFDIVITEMPDTLDHEALKPFDVIVSNWNNWPERNCSWSETTKKALLEFVENGGGYVFVHSASATNYDWPEYQELAGATWGENTKHGKIVPFRVHLTSLDHPVTKGMADFWTTDELWVNMKDFGTTNSLGEAFAPVSNNGSGEMEPVILQRKYGRGRSFFLVLGHDEQAMKNLGFQTLLVRGLEWAATGRVTQEIPDELRIQHHRSNRKLEWQEEKHSFALLNNNHIVWKYHFNPLEGKPYFHPLSIMDGTGLTWLRPDDHPWHRAVWFSWKYINGLNYWEEDRKTGKSQGITELKSKSYKLKDNHEATIYLQLSYHPTNADDILTEDRVISISSPKPDGSYFIDWETTFSAVADEVVLNRTPLPGEPNGKSWGGYAGFSVRLNRHLWDVKAVNDAGKTEGLHGKASRWITYDMKTIKGHPVSVTIFDHPDNFNYPSKWFISKTLDHPFYYFSPAVIFNSKHVLKKGDKLHLKYRLLVLPDERDNNILLDHWETFKN